jgi:hypothetical protein
LCGVDRAIVDRRGMADHRHPSIPGRDKRRSVE